MKFSIITATYNAERHLHRCLRSVLSQSWRDYEIIVQDGGSTDGTLEIVAAYGKRVNCQSGPDTGVYDAWNKALERADGEWAVFLGADDFLVSEDVLAQSRDALEQLPADVAIAYGDMALGTDGRPSRRISSPLAKIYSQFFLGEGLPFPAAFIRLSALCEHGFDPSFKIAGDLDFTLRVLRPGAIRHLPRFVTYMELGGLSSAPAHAALLLEEKKRIIRERVLPRAEEIARCCLGCLEGDPRALQQPEADAPPDTEAPTR